MINKLILITVFITLLMALFYFSPIYQPDAKANQACEIKINTETGDHKRGVLDCDGSKPTIVSSGTTISPGGSITLYVDSGDAKPPYTWTVTGIGYSIDSESNSDLEPVTLTSASGT